MNDNEPCGSFGQTVFELVHTNSSDRYEPFDDNEHRDGAQRNLDEGLVITKPVYLDKTEQILSAFYGVLRPMDGVTPYRLEMQAKASIDGAKDLYDFWGRSLYTSVRDDNGIVINLASKEYKK